MSQAPRGWSPYSNPGGKEYGGNEAHVYLTYGTISQEGVAQLISDLRVGPDNVFYDLGSGLGQVCMQVFQEAKVRKSVGIELNEQRHNLAKLNEKRSTGARGLFRELLFRNENFAETDFSDATVIFCASITFSYETLFLLAEKAARCLRLRYFVSMKRLREPLHLALI